MAIEFTCDRCDQGLKVPDDWAGRRVRCKGCNRVLKVPDPFVSQLDSSIDMDALKSGEGDSEEGEVVTEFAPIPKVTRGAARRAREEREQGKTEVQCPHCGKRIKVVDPYTEMLCSSCWKSVPPLKRTEDIHYSESTVVHAGAFYDELMSCFGYPLGALGSILLGMLMAGGAILLPVGLILMFVMGVALNPIAPKADVSWVPLLLAAMFAAEAIYFSGVAYAGLLDAARETIAESDKAPDLTWNLASVGAGILGYLTMVLVYGMVGVGVAYMVSGGEFVVPKSLDDVQQLLSPVTIVALALLTFTVPMATIGLCMMPGLDGFSPGRIIGSIGGTLVHYLFMFIVVVLMLGIYLGIMSSVIGWAIETLMTVLRKGISEGLGALIMGLLAWTVIIGAGLYGALIMGRVHGLFARVFRKRLAFD